MSNQGTMPLYSTDAGFGAYLGTHIVLGANQTPFLDRINGLNGYKPVPGEEFDLDVYSSLETPAQTVVTEANAVAGTGTTIGYVRAQHTNYIQTMLRNIDVSYKTMSNRAKMAGIYYASPDVMKEAELNFQTRMNMQQLIVNMEFSCFQGVAVAPSGSSTSVATRGLVATGSTDGAVQTNKIAGGSAYITKAKIDAMVKSMADNGAPFRDPVIFCGSFQKAKISNIYGWAPVSAPGNGLGGVAVERIQTDFAEIPVVFAPRMLSTAIVCAEMSECKIAGWEVPGKGALFLEQKAKVGAGEKWQLYAQLGLEYGEESHHGSIVALLDA
jgi:Family of unknown function (DUF5309)